MPRTLPWRSTTPQACALFFLEACKGDTRKGDSEEHPESQEKAQIPGYLQSVFRVFSGVSEYRHIRNYYLSNSNTFQDGNGNGNFGKINSNDFQDGNWESMEMKG